MSDSGFLPGIIEADDVLQEVNCGLGTPLTSAGSPGPLMRDNTHSHDEIKPCLGRGEVGLHLLPVFDSCPWGSSEDELAFGCGRWPC